MGTGVLSFLSILNELETVLLEHRWRLCKSMEGRFWCKKISENINKVPKRFNPLVFSLRFSSRLVTKPQISHWSQGEKKKKKRRYLNKIAFNKQEERKGEDHWWAILCEKPFRNFIFRTSLWLKYHLSYLIRGNWSSERLKFAPKSCCYWGAEVKFKKRLAHAAFTTYY